MDTDTTTATATDPGTDTDIGPDAGTRPEASTGASTGLRPAGTWAQASGITAVSLLASVFALPELWPVLLMTSLVAGVWAMGAAAFAQRRVRRGEEAASPRVRTGAVLGALNTAAILALVLWAIWALERAMRQ
ncbi:hypothetical protein [Streptomyces sp. WAC06614]|uniref:hypothetical protein n=1 Tax=Streptomyces sp. WAC06614 TaxID=2487416 RepID=UPI000F799464|nr:hypothetical protein [Streptomyces sp. WAC06614]RSS80115.1 hypothetical protein EF918_14935 [Streptomyces sp. WAC06614]